MWPIETLFFQIMKIKNFRSSFDHEIENTRFSCIWIPLRYWYYSSLSDTRIFKEATSYYVSRWYWYPILTSSSLSQHTGFQRYLSHRNDYKIRPSATQMLFNQGSYQPVYKARGANVALSIVCSCFHWLWYDFYHLPIREDFHFQKARKIKTTKKYCRRLLQRWEKSPNNWYSSS